MSLCVCLSVCIFFFFFFFFFFVKSFSGTTSPRILKFDANIGYDFLYRVRENQHLHAYHSLCLSFFLFFSIKFFIIDLSAS